MPSVGLFSADRGGRRLSSCAAGEMASDISLNLFKQIHLKTSSVSEGSTQRLTLCVLRVLLCDVLLFQGAIGVFS